MESYHSELYHALYDIETHMMDKELKDLSTRLSQCSKDLHTLKIRVESLESYRRYANQLGWAVGATVGIVVAINAFSRSAIFDVNLYF